MTHRITRESEAMLALRSLREEANEQVASIADHESAIDRLVRNAIEDCGNAEEEVARLRLAGKTLAPFPASKAPISEAQHDLWMIREEMSREYGEPDPENP